MKLCTLSIVLLSFISTIVIQLSSQQSTSSSTCSGHTTCGACISSKDCRWCSKEGYKSSRCAKIGEHRDCSGQINEPNPSKTVKLQDDALAETTGSSEKDLTLVKPQRVQVTLTPNQPATVDIQFKQAVDYPVDLYYLMDLSYTMKNDQKTLIKVSKTLANEMKSITSDFKLGFGSFVDKVILPYTSTTPEK